MSVPVSLVTGFLGAGKSTLINRLMQEYPDRRFGIVVNEFGDVKLESQIVDAGEDSITELPNGCMCCVVRSDLIASVAGLLDRNPGIDHLLLEASGLSDPVPIAATFLQDDLSGRVRFDSVICVVDVLHFLDSLDNYAIASQQIVFSDFVLLSKVEEAGPAFTARVRALIAIQRPNARIIELRDGAPLDLLIDVTDIDHSSIEGLEVEEHHHHHDDEGKAHGRENTAGWMLKKPMPPASAGSHASGSLGEPRAFRSIATPVDGQDRVFRHPAANADGGPKAARKKVYRHAHEKVDTLFYKSERPLNLDAFTRLLNHIPRTVIRAKGFLLFDDPRAQDRKYLLQLVGWRPVLEMRRWRDGEKKQSALVFIGRGFDTVELERALAACESGA